MNQNTSHSADSCVRIHATVTDVIGVQRVLTLLNGRKYPLTRFEAEDAGRGCWRLRVETSVAQPEHVELLAARLQRVPSTLVVDVQTASNTSATPRPGSVTSPMVEHT